MFLRVDCNSPCQLPWPGETEPLFLVPGGFNAIACVNGLLPGDTHLPLFCAQDRPVLAAPSWGSFSNVFTGTPSSVPIQARAKSGVPKGHRLKLFSGTANEVTPLPTPGLPPPAGGPLEARAHTHLHTHTHKHMRMRARVHIHYMGLLAVASRALCTGA